MPDYEPAWVALAEVIRALRARGVDRCVTLIGGQVVPLERQARGVPVFELGLSSGDRVTIPFSREPDLIFDRTQAGAQVDAIEEVLRALGFQRTAVTWRWRRQEVELDVVTPDTAGRRMDLEIAVVRTRVVSLDVAAQRLEIQVPDPAAFLRLKLNARAQRPEPKDKDSFDIYAYAKTVPAAEIEASLVSAREGPSIRSELKALFFDMHSAGTLEATRQAAQGSADTDLHELIARDVVDTIADLTG
jgi:hypothetical protein